MSARASTASQAFRCLERNLLRRRWLGLDRRLALELLLLVAFGWAFLFWQSRLALDALARSRGPAGLLMAIGAVWGVLALTIGSLAGAGIARSLRRGLPGLAWLSLPISAHLVLRHVAWDARMRSLWPALFAPPVLAATIGLVPPWWLALLAAWLVWFVIEASRLGCAIAWRLVLRESETRPVASLLRLLSAGPHQAPRASRPPARWRRSPRWIALWRKDALLATGSGALHGRFRSAAISGALAVAAWWWPTEPGVSRLLALALALISATALGEWLIALAAEDPFHFLRAQPCGVGAMWTARAAWAALGAGVIGGAQLAAAHGIPPHARQMFAGWVAGATFTIALIAIHYSLTLYPHTERAARMLSLTLAIAMAASLMFPLAGWLVLLTALIHSARRLPRWARLEPSA